MNRSELINALRQYTTEYYEESTFIRDFILLLEHPRAYYRDHFPGHMTGSSWIIDASKKNVLLTHHAKLNRWLQPGGHADGEEDIVNVALKEAQEETGLQNLLVINRKSIFDIDIHPIPERNGIPEHLHYDVRILMQANNAEPLHISEESHELAWVPTENLAAISHQNTSMLRMASKVSKLFTADE